MAPLNPARPIDTTTRPLLTAERVADHLQLSIRSVRRLIAAGELPSVKIGRLIRVMPAALDAFLAKRTVGDSK